MKNTNQQNGKRNSNVKMIIVGAPKNKTNLERFCNMRMLCSSVHLSTKNTANKISKPGEGRSLTTGRKE
jgi:hypothetical protein